MFLDARAEVRARMKQLVADRGVAFKETAEYKNLDLQQQVWKILANSLYGILGSEKTRYFDVRLAESITHGGRVCLNLAIEWFEMNGYQVIAGDTDSTFTLLGGIDPKVILPEFHEWLHTQLRERWGCQNPTITLGFEKRYKRLAVCGKKHYYGILDDDTFNGMGMDHKKRVTIPIAAKLLKMMLNHLVTKKEDVKFLRRLG